MRAYERRVFQSPTRGRPTRERAILIVNPVFTPYTTHDHWFMWMTSPPVLAPVNLARAAHDDDDDDRRSTTRRDA